MTTFFRQYKQKKLFIRDDISKSNMTYCVRDWNLYSQDIKVNNIQLKPPEGGFTPDSLKLFWQQNLIPQGLSETQEKKLMCLLEESFCEGGMFYVLRAQLNAVARPLGHNIGESHSQINIKIINGKLVLKEEINVDKIILNARNVANRRKVNAGKEEHLLSGSAIFSIDLSTDSLVIECDDLVLLHHHKVAENIFDTRSVLDKIVDFLKALVNLNKLDDPFLEKEQPGMKNT